MTALHERTTDFLEGTGRRRRGIVSPEGVRLSVALADITERSAAFLIDFAISSVVTTVIYLIAFVLFFSSAGIVVSSVLLFIAFLVRNLYFIFFETAWLGATPGKRALGLRVIDRRGGPLRPTAIIARNLTREIETFIPLGLLMQPVITTGAAAERLALVTWFLLLSALPLMNRDRLRAGDIIGGTMVIALPRRVLLGDIVEESFHYRFADKQLGSYGAFELQVLEELLRRPDSYDTRQLCYDVGEKIRAKIGWNDPVARKMTYRFLRDFYAAERAFLEREQLYGRPRADKESIRQS